VTDLVLPDSLRAAPRIADTTIASRCFPAVARRTQRLPATAAPKHRLITAVRMGVIVYAFRPGQLMSLAVHAQRMLVQEGGTFGARALRAIERAGFWTAFPRIVLVALTLLAPSNRTVDRWTNGHGGDLKKAVAENCNTTSCKVAF